MPALELGCCRPDRALSENGIQIAEDAQRRGLESDSKRGCSGCAAERRAERHDGWGSLRVGSVWSR